MPSKRLVKDPERYKTVLCANWESSGKCPYGRKCQFAHSREELRARAAGPTGSPPQEPMARPPPPPMSLPMNLPSSSMQGLTGLPMPRLSIWPTGHVQLPGQPPLPLGPPPTAMSNATPPAPRAALPLPPLPPGPHPSTVPAAQPPPPAQSGPPPVIFDLSSTPLRLPMPGDQPLGHTLPSFLNIASADRQRKSDGSCASVSTADYADELACLAMKCHIDSDDKIGQDWSPFRCNDATQKIEMVESPVEPGLNRREVSFSTQMVRRAVSFIFDEGERLSPVLSRTSSPDRHHRLASQAVMRG